MSTSACRSVSIGHLCTSFNQQIHFRFLLLYDACMFSWLYTEYKEDIPTSVIVTCEECVTISLYFMSMQCHTGKLPAMSQRQSSCSIIVYSTFQWQYTWTYEFLTWWLIELCMIKHSYCGQPLGCFFSQAQSEQNNKWPNRCHTQGTYTAFSHILSGVPN